MKWSAERHILAVGEQRQFTGRPAGRAGRGREGRGDEAEGGWRQGGGGG